MYKVTEVAYKKIHCLCSVPGTENSYFFLNEGKKSGRLLNMNLVLLNWCRYSSIGIKWFFSDFDSSSANHIELTASKCSFSRQRKVFLNSIIRCLLLYKAENGILKKKHLNFMINEKRFTFFCDFWGERLLSDSHWCYLF